MLLFGAHFALLLVVLFACSKATPKALTSVYAAGDFGLFELRGNDSDQQFFDFRPQNPMIQCIGVLRGILLTAGVHLEPTIEAVGRCPENVDSELANLCSTDYHNFPEEVGSVDMLQEELLSKLNSGNSRGLGKHLNLVIRKVSPVLDPSSGLIYANSYCASCYGVKTKKLPTKLLCDHLHGVMKCFVTAEMPENVTFCKPGAPSPRFYFSWDSIFILPENGDEHNEDIEVSTKVEILEIFQWICCTFSLVTLILAICVFSTSPRLRRPLPGKMMIALCVTLLGSVIAFILASGVMDIISTPMRPLCVTSAWLLILFLLSSFAWMVMFSVELFRTFGLTRLLQQFFLCYQCRKGQGGKANAMSMMLRARESDSNSSNRFKCQMIASVVTPLCFGIPALVINEHAYSRIEPVFNKSADISWSQSTEEAELGSSLYRINPRFCPVTDPNYAWFKGNYFALLTWFLIPAGIMISFNLLALLVVCIQICRLKRETGLPSTATGPHRDVHKKPSKSLIGVCAKLAVILGASWFIQLLAGLCPQLKLLRKIAGLMNSAQGGAIALFMLAGSKARRAMAQWLPKRWQNALGVSDFTTPSTQEMTISSRLRSRMTAQTNSSQTTSLLQSACS